MIYLHVYGSVISGSSADRAQQQYDVPGLRASDYSCLKYITRTELIEQYL